MGFTIRTISTDCKFSEALTLDALQQIIPPTLVRQAVRAHSRTPRQRKLTPEVIVWLLIALHLFPSWSVGAVFQHLAHGLRLLWPDPTLRLPGESALCYRRAQLGLKPLLALFRQVCRPLATPATPGAFYQGYRLVALDGTLENVPDTPANAAAFGRRSSQRGVSVYPQVQGVYLAECGTHAIFAAHFARATPSEHRLARRLLWALEPEMLVLWDCGFHSFEWLSAVGQRGAQVLARLPAHVRPQLLRPLPDGSHLVALRPPRGRRGQPPLLMRLIRYTLSDPRVPGAGKTYRLLTTLLDVGQYPARDLAGLYHERWEIEGVFDEQDTHQRLAARTLRSQQPVGVLQELYGLLLAHYAVRALMHEAALRAGLDPDRLSFTQAVRVIGEAILDFQVVAAAQWPQLYARLLDDLTAARLPRRRLRSNPRAVRRRASKFAQKRPDQRGTTCRQASYQELIVLLPLSDPPAAAASETKPLPQGEKILI